MWSASRLKSRQLSRECGKKGFTSIKVDASKLAHSARNESGVMINELNIGWGEKQCFWIKMTMLSRVVK